MKDPARIRFKIGLTVAATPIRPGGRRFARHDQAPRRAADRGVRAGDALGRSELRGGDHLHKSARPLAGIGMSFIVSTEVVGFELERRSV